MSHVTLMTRDLVGLLSCALLTASTDEDYPALNSVLLDCDHADVRIESPGDKGEPPLIDTVESNVLVASAMDGMTMASQGHAPCDGWLHRAVLLNAVDVEAVIKTFTSKAKQAPKNDIHRTKVTVSSDGVTFGEVHESILDGMRMTVATMDLGDYPHGIHTTLCPDPVSEVVDRETKKPVPPAIGSALAPAAWEIVTKVMKARQAPAVMYRYHQNKLHVVEVGTMWRAVFRPTRLDDPKLVCAAPRVPVFTPRLPKKAEDAMQDELLRTGSGAVLSTSTT